MEVNDLLLEKERGILSTLEKETGSEGWGLLGKDRLSNTNRNGDEKLKQGHRERRGESDKQMNCGKETG